MSTCTASIPSMNITIIAQLVILYIIRPHSHYNTHTRHTHTIESTGSIWKNFTYTYMYVHWLTNAECTIATTQHIMLTQNERFATAKKSCPSLVATLQLMSPGLHCTHTHTHTKPLQRSAAKTKTNCVCVTYTCYVCVLVLVVVEGTIRQLSLVITTLFVSGPSAVALGFQTKEAWNHAAHTRHAPWDAW